MSIGADDLDDQLDYSFDVGSEDGVVADERPAFSEEEDDFTDDEEEVSRKRRASDAAEEVKLDRAPKKQKKAKSKKLTEKVCTVASYFCGRNWN